MFSSKGRDKRSFHATLLTFLAITFLIVILVCFGFLSIVYAEAMLPIYLTEVILTFVIYFIVKNYVYRNYH